MLENKVAVVTGAADGVNYIIDGGRLLGARKS
jgi:hypothetical protein